MTTTIPRWVIALSITLASLILAGFLTVMTLGAGEEICFDRHPWWGPPESGSNPDCAGHFYEAWQAGYYPWNMPR